MAQQTLFLNCPNCKKKKAVIKHELQELTFSGYDSYDCIRITQWRCGYCAYNKVELNINNNAQKIVLK